METLTTPLAVIAHRISGTLETPASAGVATSGNARVDVSVAVARLTESARLVGISVVPLVTLTAVRSLVATRTLALYLRKQHVQCSYVRHS